MRSFLRFDPLKLLPAHAYGEPIPIQTENQRNAAALDVAQSLRLPSCRCAREQTLALAPEPQRPRPTPGHAVRGLLELGWLGLATCKLIHHLALGQLNIPN